MIKKVRIAVDHGNRNMKTCSQVFTTGLTIQDKKPARGEKFLFYEGKYYVLSENRIPYQRDKTQDDRFFYPYSICNRKRAGGKPSNSAGGCHSGGSSDWAATQALCRTL